MPLSRGDNTALTNGGDDSPPSRDSAPGSDRRSSAMDDIRHRDLSEIPESEMTAEERRELKRRFEEFVGLVRRPAVAGSPGQAPSPKQPQRWDPATMGQRGAQPRHGRHA